MALTPGTRLGIYDVTAQIGEGGMGQVYRARDTKLNRDVALKVLPDSFADDADRLARFTREARTLASLNHPNIAHIHGLEESGGVRALVMELVEGDDLSQRIARGAIPIDEALPIAKQIADALEAAHEQGIIHRDLKPANIKVRSDGTVKVLDFGLAKAMDPGAGSSPSLSMSPTITSPAMLTGVGMVLGTAAYMSPEQARGKTVDRRADIWAFGVVLFEMLTGQRAFSGEDITDTLAAVVKLDPRWDAVGADVPARVRQVLRVCLQKDPKQRAQAIGDVRLALDGAFETAGPPAATPMVGRRRTREYVAWGLAAVATLLAIGVFLVFLRAPRQPDAVVRFSVVPPIGVVRQTIAGFEVAPDGQAIAFAARSADGVFRIFVRHLDATESQPVAGTDGARAPFWAPDGRSLGFAKEGGLYRVGLDGSAPRLICSIAVASALAFSGTWGSRGVIVFSLGSALQQVPDTGGTPRPVTTLDATAKEAAHLWPWFLPDGRHVLFLALAEGQARGTIWATAIDDPARTRLVESSGAAAYAGGWLFSTTPAPRSLVAQRFDSEHLTLRGMPQQVRDRLPLQNTGGFRGFAVSSTGVVVVDRPPLKMSQLVWVDRAGREVATVGPRANISSFALAPDERRVVAEITPPEATGRVLWLFDGVREEGTRLTYEGSAVRPLWARDGRHIYFRHSGKLQTLAIGASAATAFENPGPFSAFEDATKDGRFLVFKSLKVPPEVWIQRVDSAERRALVQGAFAAMWPRVSPDSRWLAYVLGLSTTLEVFAQPFDRPGERIQVSAKGGFGPIWRDDGRELYYEGPEGLMAVPITERGGALEAGTPQKLFAIRTQDGVANQPHNVEVAAHGQKFLVNTIVGDSDNAPLEVTLHWTAGLEK